MARLVYVSGKVMAQLPGANTETPATFNAPIEEGYAVSTLAGGYADVGLENGSMIQMSELSKARFTQLSTDASGNKQSVIKLEQGSWHFISSLSMKILTR